MMRRGVASAVAGVALLASASGCGRITEKAVEKAVEQNSECSNVDIDVSEGGFSGDCAGGGVDLSAKGNASIPTDWPAELAPPENIRVSGSTDNPGPPRSLTVIGGVDGEAQAIIAGIKEQLTGAGFEILNESELPGGATITASGAQWEANVTVTTAGAEAVNGALSISYILTAAG